MPAMGRWYVKSPGTQGPHELCHQQPCVTTPSIRVPATLEQAQPSSQTPQSQPCRAMPHVPAAVIQQLRDSAVPGPAPTAGGPSQGTEQPSCQPWQHHPRHSQSLGSFPLPAPAMAHPAPQHHGSCGGHPIPCQRELHGAGSGRKRSRKLEKHQLVSGGNNSLPTWEKDSDLYMWWFCFFQS